MTKNPKTNSTVILLLLLTVFSTFAQEINKKEESERLLKEAIQNVNEKKLDDAIEKANIVLEWFPKSAQAFVVRALAYTSKGLGEKAIEDYTSALNLDADDKLKLTSQRMRGITFYQIKKYAEAIKDLDFVISKDGTNAQDFVFRGWSYLHLGNHQSAVENFNSAIKINPQAISIRRFRAFSHFKLGRYENAVEDINEELKINDKPHIEVYKIRADAYRKLGKNDLAELDEKKFVELGGKVKSRSESVEQKTPNADLMKVLKKAEAHFEKREWDLAIQAFNEAIKFFDSNDELLYALYFSRGRAYFELGSYDSAFSDYNEVIKRKPDLASGFTFRGEVYLQRNDYENALKDFNKAIEIDKTDILAFRRRAEVFYLIKEYPKAINDASDVLKLDPKYAIGWYFRGVSYFETGKYQLAVNDLTEYIKLIPDEYEVYLDRAKAFRKLKKIKEAEADELKAKELQDQQNSK